MSVLLQRPLLLEPRTEPRVWGGRRLADDLGRCLEDGPIGESWEVHGELRVSEGPAQGRTLDSLVVEFGNRLLGTRSASSEHGFPLLTKWLDCREWLSVQVHPDDALAQELTGDITQRGKSEAWYVAKTEPGAALIHGLASDNSMAKLLASEGRSMLTTLGYQSPPPGALLYTAAGTVHALGPGYLIYEVQQSSDLTYRLYDWGRDRPLHPAEAKRCLQEARPPQARQTADSLHCPFFEIETVTAPSPLEVDSESFVILAAVEGAWKVHGDFPPQPLPYGRSLVLPAALGTVQVQGEGRLLVIRQGQPQTHDRRVVAHEGAQATSLQS